jgi:hypothetical protein
MSTKIQANTELPVISSLIQVDSELLSKKSSELSEKRTSEYKSDESIKIGDGVPRRTVGTSSSSNTSVTVTQNETSNLLYISGIGLFLVIAGLSYYFYINYRKNKQIQ